MTILVLEDRPEMLSTIDDVLSDAGYSVYPCLDIYEANEVWNNNKIDVIITDLSLSPDGLTYSEKMLTNGAIISGWIWLIDYVIKKDETFIDYCIIFSEYINDAKEIISRQKISEELFSKVCKLEKSSQDSLSQLLGEIRKRQGGETYA